MAGRCVEPKQKGKYTVKNGGMIRYGVHHENHLPNFLNCLAMWPYWCRSDSGMCEWQMGTSCLVSKEQLMVELELINVGKTWLSCCCGSCGSSSLSVSSILSSLGMITTMSWKLTLRRLQGLLHGLSILSHVIRVFNSVFCWTGSFGVFGRCEGSLQFRTGERQDSLVAALNINDEGSMFDEQHCQTSLFESTYTWVRGVSGMIFFFKPYFWQVFLSSFKLVVNWLLDCLRNCCFAKKDSACRWTHCRSFLYLCSSSCGWWFSLGLL